MGEQVNILLRQEKYEQAEGLAREVLTLRRRALRVQHPEIATAISLFEAPGRTANIDKPSERVNVVAARQLDCCEQLRYWKQLVDRCGIYAARTVLQAIS